MKKNVGCIQDLFSGRSPIRNRFANDTVTSHTPASHHTGRGPCHRPPWGARWSRSPAAPSPASRPPSTGARPSPSSSYSPPKNTLMECVAENNVFFLDSWHSEPLMTTKLVSGPRSFFFFASCNKFIFLRCCILWTIPIFSTA